MARLKTYTAQIDGLNDWIVAAPNQKAALEAFGVHQNLFAQGLAEATTEAALVEAAAASPGVPLKRRKGGKGKFTAGPAESDWSGALKAAATGGKARKAPSRARLDKARAALAKAQAQAETELTKLEAEAKAAARRLDAARTRLEETLAKAREDADAAEAAYRKAASD